MKNYFININFHNGRDINKFLFGIIEADLSNEGLIDIARRFLTKEGHSIDGMTINVTAFNEVGL